ncbi:MAG: ABC transporter substrate-binding protein [Actinomycetota bacterium]|nr:MAG: ABC transporter substrate-binding protein [Actinomycetota bacterium]
MGGVGQLRRAAVAGVAVAVASALVSGCGSSEAAGTAPTASADLAGVTLRVGQTGYGNVAALLKAAGIDSTPYKVEFSVFQGGNLQLEAMAAGALDVATTSEIPPIFASLAAGGGNFKIVAVQRGSTLQQEVLVPAGSTITDIAGLKGKRVAYVKSTTAQYFLDKLLRQAGLSWTDVTAVDLTVPDGLAALLSGQVDALATYGNAVVGAHAKGAVTIGTGKDVLSGNFPWETTPAVISDAAKSAALADLFGRVQRGYEWARAHADEWAAIVAGLTKQPVDQALNTFLLQETQTPTQLVAVSDKAIASQQDVADVLRAGGTLPKQVDVAGLWSDAFTAALTALPSPSARAVSTASPASGSPAGGSPAAVSSSPATATATASSAARN